MVKYADNPDDYLRAGKPGEPTVELTATEARQGSWGRPVLYVLVCALILAAIAWWAAEYYGTAIAPPVTDPATTSSVTKDPLADNKMIDNNQPKGEPVQKSPAIQDSNKL